VSVPDPAGELTSFPRPPKLYLRGLLLREGRGYKKMGREGGVKGNEKGKRTGGEGKGRGRKEERKKDERRFAGLMSNCSYM